MNTRKLREIVEGAPLRRPSPELDARIESLFASASGNATPRHRLIRILSMAAGIVVVTILLFIMSGSPTASPERGKTVIESGNIICLPLDENLSRTFIRTEKPDNIFEQEISSVKFVETK